MRLKSRSVVVALVVAISAPMLGSAPAAAQCGLLHEYLEITADIPLNRASFGSAMAIDGTMALIAADSDSELASTAGAVFVFDIANPANPVQRFKLLADDGDDYDYFGSSVALHDNLAIVGAQWDEPVDEHSGSAYIFDVSTGQQRLKLVPSDGAYHNEFGSSVAMNETIAAVGSPNDSTIARWAGSVHLFDVHTGEQIVKLIPHDPSAGAHFGSAMALQGHTLIVGAERDDQAEMDCGAVYVFDVSDPANPVEMSKLMPGDASAFQLFGCCVALSGNIAVIGSLWDDDRGYQSGSAYLFDIISGTQLAKVRPDRFSRDDNLGSSVSIRGRFIVVGAQSPYDAGYAFVYDISDVSRPSRFARLEGSTVRSYESFGSSVGITGNTVLVGARSHEYGVGAGAAYCFDIDCGPTLSLNGSCPGPMSLTASGATPNGDVAILYARNRGSVMIPHGYPCAGTQIGLGASAALAGSRRADSDGNVTFSATVPPVACGNIFVQALDLTSCGPSNVVPIEQ